MNRYIEKYKILRRSKTKATFVFIFLSTINTFLSSTVPYVVQSAKYTVVRETERERDREREYYYGSSQDAFESVI